MTANVQGEGLTAKIQQEQECQDVRVDTQVKQKKKRNEAQNVALTAIVGTLLAGGGAGLFVAADDFSATPSINDDGSEGGSDQDRGRAFGLSGIILGSLSLGSLLIAAVNAIDDDLGRPWEEQEDIVLRPFATCGEVENPQGTIRASLGDRVVLERSTVGKRIEVELRKFEAEACSDTDELGTPLAVSYVPAGQKRPITLGQMGIDDCIREHAILASLEAARAAAERAGVPAELGEVAEEIASASAHVAALSGGSAAKPKLETDLAEVRNGLRKKANQMFTRARAEFDQALGLGKAIDDGLGVQFLDQFVAFGSRLDRTSKLVCKAVADGHECIKSYGIDTLALRVDSAEVISEVTIMLSRDSFENFDGFGTEANRAFDSAVERTRNGWTVVSEEEEPGADCYEKIRRRRKGELIMQESVGGCLEGGDQPYKFATFRLVSDPHSVALTGAAVAGLGSLLERQSEVVDVVYGGIAKRFAKQGRTGLDFVEQTLARDPVLGGCLEEDAGAECQVLRSRLSAIVAPLVASVAADLEGPRATLEQLGAQLSQRVSEDTYTRLVEAVRSTGAMANADCKRRDFGESSLQKTCGPLLDALEAAKGNLTTHRAAVEALAIERKAKERKDRIAATAKAWRSQFPKCLKVQKGLEAESTIRTCDDTCRAIKAQVRADWEQLRSFNVPGGELDAPTQQKLREECRNAKCPSCP